MKYELTSQLVSKKKILYCRLLLEPMIRWIQKCKSRAFASWAYHTHIGVRIHIRSRKREGLLRASHILVHARLPGSKLGLLHRGWNKWYAVVADCRRKQARQKLSARILHRVVQSSLSFMKMKALNTWKKFDYLLLTKQTVGTRKLAMQLGRIIKGFMHRKLSQAWRTWTTSILLDNYRVLVVHSHLSSATKILDNWNNRIMSRAFYRWVDIDTETVARRIANAKSCNRGFVMLYKMLFIRTPRRRLNRAFFQWVKFDHRTRHIQNQIQLLNEHAASQIRLQNERKANKLSGIVYKRKIDEKNSLAVACWRWCSNAASIQISKLNTDAARRKMQITRMESKCAVYRNQQIRDAAISASFEKELIGLRQRVKGLKQNQKEEKRIERDHNLRRAILRLISIKSGQERLTIHNRITTAWLCWREYIGQHRQIDLAHKLERTRHQQRQAAGRITSLVERAQRERAQTVKLLLTMKQRTSAMEDQVVDHLVSSAPGLSQAGSGKFLSPTPFVTPQASGKKKSTGLVPGRKKKKSAKKKLPKSPMSQDPYNLIVDQLLRVVRSQKRTLYSHSITDLLTLFQAIDLNCDGNISNAEFADAMKRLDIDITKDQLTHLLEEMRREDGRISYRGFVQSMKHHHDALRGLADNGEDVRSIHEENSSSIRRGSYFGTYKVDNDEEEDDEKKEE
jgi:hypothetical protein